MSANRAKALRLSNDLLCDNPNSMHFVFVHGIAQENRSSRELETEWIASFNKGIGSSQQILCAQVPFYGDLLDEWTHPDHRMRGDSDYNQFAKSFATEALLKSPQDVVAFINEVEERYSDDDRDRGPQNNPAVIALARRLDAHFPTFSLHFIETFLRSVHTYLTLPDARSEIDGLVARAIADSAEPTVVVSHSLGTVVAYNVLNSIAAIHVKRFVTIGSPLAINAVVSRLPPSKPGHEFPVSDWYNAFDDRDIVALNPLDASSLRARSGIRNEHDGIENKTDNHHGISGYLEIPVIASSIAMPLR
jgi:hypothetical protein